MTESINFPSGSIDRRSPIPLYFQLKKLLEEEIAAGRLAPGDRLPSEPTICARFFVSRTTVRQALAKLESDGQIRKEKGRGTFIADPHSNSWHLQSAQGFYDEAVRHGHEVTSRVLRLEVALLPRWASNALGLPPGSDGVTLERLRFIDEWPVMYVLNHLPPHLAETVLSADFEHGSLYRTLEEREALTVLGGRRLVEAVNAEEELAALLGVEPGAAVLFVESVSWQDERRPFECYRAWHRADRTKIEVQVLHEEIATRAGVSTSTLRIQ
ncbi:MAG: GntR family transcriptional regulator [Gaiellaceae bacterium]